MKSAVLALLATSVAAQPPSGTAAIDCGECDEAAYTLWSENVLAVDGEAPVACLNDDVCIALDNSNNTCVVWQIGDKAQSSGICRPVGDCNNWVDWSISSSDQTQTRVCNDESDVAAEQALDITDYTNWTQQTAGLTSCEVSADCTWATEDCATVAYGAIITRNFCVPYDGKCSELGVDVTTFPQLNSDSDITFTCRSEDYLVWLWKEVTYDMQWNNSYQDCATQTTETDCTTIEWGGETVDAWCGTATVKDFDSAYAKLGCYPLADCALMGGVMPQTEVLDTALMYELECGASTLFASAFAAVALASAI